MATLGPHAYGKSTVRLVRVLRGPARHDVRDLTIDIRLEGEFDRAYTAGDNSRILPTDTMKNAVYVLADQQPIESVPRFALRVARHLLESGPASRRVTVEIEERPWQDIPAAHGAHTRAFHRGGAETSICRVVATADGSSVDCGFKNLELLKTGGSAFVGFARDPLTTLEDEPDRLLATSAEVSWRLRDDNVDFEQTASEARRAVIQTFAARPSNSLQQLLFDIGAAVLETCEPIDEVRLRLSNLHHVRVDLAPFGLQNRDEVYVALREPYGLIEGTVRR